MLGAFSASFLRRRPGERIAHAGHNSYVDLASNAVVQTTAMAHPATPASDLFEMARLISSSITMTMADWLKHKALPT